VAYRLPRLRNAADLHSDAAIVGLQAMHFLRGEWSPFLWGSGYQTSVDSAVAAIFFILMGPTALALRLSTFLGFLGLTLLVYGTLRRHVSDIRAALLVMPLVFTPTPVHIYVFSPPRQAALTLVFLGVFLVDGARVSKRPARQLALGGMAFGFACFADPYALLFLPSAVLIVLAAVEAADGGQRKVRLTPAAVGCAVGLLPFVSVLSRTDATPGVLSLSPRMVLHNWKLLWTDCMPFLLSTKVFAPTEAGPWTPWQAPWWFRIVELCGAVLFAAAIFAGGVVSARRRVTPPLAALGAFGAVTMPVAIGAFLFSVMPIDHFSARYLVGILLAAPFALAPVVEVMGERAAATVLAPYLVSSAVAGWLGYGSEAPGSSLRFGRDMVLGDRALYRALHERGIRYAIADYWAAYRLTFLSREEFVVVPWHASQDRYAPYRARVANAPVIAYVYDPLESLELLDDRRALFESGDTEYSRDVATLHADRYTILVLTRDAGRDQATRPVFPTAAR
jgi:hypothetical protein